MQNSTLINLATAIESIAEETNTEIEDILSLLTGTAWDEEEASQLREYML